MPFILYIIALMAYPLALSAAFYNHSSGTLNFSPVDIDSNNDIKLIDVEFNNITDIDIGDHFKIEVGLKFNGRDASLGDSIGYIPILSPLDNDRLNLFNLSSSLGLNKNIYQFSINRLNLKYTDDSYNIYIGRDAKTIGHGLIFNPADIFQPQTPSSNLWSYKPAMDVIGANVYLGGYSSLSFIGSVRRNFFTEDVTLEDSTLFIQYLYADNKGYSANLNLAQYMQNIYISAGYSLNIPGGVMFYGDIVNWITDKSYNTKENYYFAGVLGIQKDFYQENSTYNIIAEYFYNQMGSETIIDNTNITKSYINPVLAQRFIMGDIYLKDAHYGSVGLNTTIYENWNISASTILNLKDVSGFVMASGSYDIRYNFSVFASLAIGFGNSGDEFGSISLGNNTYKPPKLIMIGLAYN